MNDKERPVCTAIRKDGQACRARAVVNGLCIGHQPPNPEWRRKGGQNSSTAHRLQKFVPSQLKSLFKTLEAAMIEVHSGKLDHRKGQAMASLASAMVKLFEVGLVEERLEWLEEMMKGEGK